MIEMEVRQTGKQALVSTMAMENISRAYEKGETMHIHPTVSESIPTLMGELKPLQ